MTEGGAARSIRDGTMNFDKINMIVGAVIGSALVFLLLGFFGGQIFGTRYDHEPETLAFALEVEDEGAGEAEEEETVDLAALAAAADPAAGEKVFNKCKACHKVEDGANGVGPHLWGVVGREIAGVGGYSYSDALSAKEGAWDLETLSAWLADPNGWAPGNKMGNAAAVTDPEDRVNLIAWLNEADGSPIELSAAPVEVSAEEPADEAGSETAEAATDDGAESLEETAEATDPVAGDDDADATAAADGTAAADAGDAAEAGAETADTAADTGSGTSTAFLAGADVAAGEKLFRQCRACHQVEDGRNGVGPYLYNLVGREIASVDGYSYSDALSAKDGIWDPETISAFIADPRGWAPGTKMGYAGLKDEQGRKDLIAWLGQQADEPLAIPASAPAAAEPDDQEEASTDAPAEDGTASDTAATDTGTDTGTESAAADGAADEAAGEAGMSEEAETAAEAVTETAATDAAADAADAAGGETEVADETEVAGGAAGGAYADLLAAADADAGAKVFRQCRACHKIEDGARGVGPHLWNVVGRDIASVDGYGYSDALAAKDGAWTLDNLMAWLENPRDWANGTKMAFPGVRDAQDRINVIVYINEEGDAPAALE